MTSSLALLPPATHPFWRSADVAEQARREAVAKALCAQWGPGGLRLRSLSGGTL